MRIVVITTVAGVEVAWEASNQYLKTRTSLASNLLRGSKIGQKENAAFHSGEAESIMAIINIRKLQNSLKSHHVASSCFSKNLEMNIIIWEEIIGVTFLKILHKNMRRVFYNRISQQLS